MYGMTGRHSAERGFGQDVHKALCSLRIAWVIMLSFLELSRDRFSHPPLLSSLPLALPFWYFEFGDARSNAEGHMNVEGQS